MSMLSAALTAQRSRCQQAQLCGFRPIVEDMEYAFSDFWGTASVARHYV
jgi:hypothetical protein